MQHVSHLYPMNFLPCPNMLGAIFHAPRSRERGFVYTRVGSSARRSAERECKIVPSNCSRARGRPSGCRAAPRGEKRGKKTNLSPRLVVSRRSGCAPRLYLAADTRHYFQLFYLPPTRLAPAGTVLRALESTCPRRAARLFCLPVYPFQSSREILIVIAIYGGSRAMGFRSATIDRRRPRLPVGATESDGNASLEIPARERFDSGDPEATLSSAAL